MAAKPQQAVSGAKQTTQSSFIMLTQMMGSSILAVPFVVHKIGWIGSALLLVHSVASMYFFMYYYISGCYYMKAKSYKDLTVKLMGKKVGVLLDFALLLSYYGFMVAYVIISSRGVVDFVKNVINHPLNPYAVKIVIAAVIIFPLCLLKSLKQLSSISTIAGLVIFLFIGTIVVFFFLGVGKGEVCRYQEDGVEHVIKYGLNAFPNTTPGLGILWILQYVASWHGNFGAHPVVPRFLKELVGPYPYRKVLTLRALLIALIIVVTCLALVGFLGAAMFGDSIQQNILQAFTPCAFIWMDIIALLYAFVVIINFPLVLYPLKASLVQSFGSEMETKKGYKISIVIDIIVVIAATMLALFLESIVSIFGLFASIAGALYYFIIPAFCFMHYEKLKKDRAFIDEIKEGEDLKVDNVATAVIALATGTDEATIEKVRRLSNKLFQQQELVADPLNSEKKSRRNSAGRFSIRAEDGVQERTFSIKSGGAEKPRADSGKLNHEDEGKRLVVASVAQVVAEADAELASEAKKKTRQRSSSQASESSMLSQSVDEHLEENADAEVGDNTAAYVPTKLSTLSKQRVTCGFVIIGIYMCFCLIGVVFNMIDVVDAFSGSSK